MVVKSLRKTKWWDRQSASWLVIDAGAEVRVLFDSELAAYVGSAESRSLRDCRDRMKRDGDPAVLGLHGGRVRCWSRADLDLVG